MRSKISSKAHAPGGTVYYGCNAAWPIRIPWMYRCEYISIYNEQCYSRSISIILKASVPLWLTSVLPVKQFHEGYAIQFVLIVFVCVMWDTWLDCSQT